jgi:dTDP-4-amino-4,6-dideoxy-D-galactose acyltransferase
MNNLFGYIDILDWESSFFKRKIALFSFNENGEKIEDNILQAYDLVQSKIKCCHYNFLDILQSKGFALAETEIVCFYNNLKALDKRPDYRYAQKHDIDKVLALSSGLFSRNTRFRSPWFTIAEKNNFYNKWLINAILGKFDDKCMLIEDKKKIIGFITIRFLDKKTARIGLVGVDLKYRQQGIGYKLISIAKHECRQNNINNMYVSTQISNIGAMHLYEITGASIIETNYWLYYG